ncbi:MAG: dTDP-4-dehydrorhamnose 3,5-epimerase [Oscillospiraceae bacterium]|nr:dTDP-4-dehydrorhamnose 3,5-epimerase [Oscillospiraceae bacterium]
MGKFRFLPAPVEGVVVVEPTVFGDSRGYFMETYNQNEFAQAGITAGFVQDNQSRSARGVLRGLHLQKTRPQAKLVRCLEGEVFDVCADLRPGSPTYGRWYGLMLSGENRRQLFIPRGLAHGFLVLSETAVFAYKCDEFYCPEDEAGLLWNDPGIGIEWPLDGIGPPALSERDRRWPKWEDAGREGHSPPPV